MEPSNSEIISAINQLKQEKNKLNERRKQMSQKMLNSLDYTDKKEKNEKQEQTSFFRKMIEIPKNFVSSTFYHVKMVYLIPLNYISENCCKKRLPSSFFKKNI